MKLLRLMGILFLLLAAGCGPADPEPGGYGVEDVRGKSVRLSHPPQKILTDSLHLDETLLTLVPAERLAGAYYLDREPGISFVAEETRKVEPVLRDYTPETVARVKPDLFLASTWSDPGLIQKVEEMGIPVVVCYGPVDLEQIQKNVRLMAHAVGNPQGGEKVISQMEERLQQTEQVLSGIQGPEPVGMLVSLMSRYGGTGSLYDDLCRRAHIRNGLAEAGLKNGQPLTREGILQANPDFFWFLSPMERKKKPMTDSRNSFLETRLFRLSRGMPDGWLCPTGMFTMRLLWPSMAYRLWPTELTEGNFLS